VVGSGETDSQAVRNDIAHPTGGNLQSAAEQANGMRGKMPRHAVNAVGSLEAPWLNRSDFSDAGLNGAVPSLTADGCDTE
jgi:hypothetical protein